jgi:hypothetical protein
VLKNIDLANILWLWLFRWRFKPDERPLASSAGMTIFLPPAKNNGNLCFKGLFRPSALAAWSVQEAAQDADN